jgi:AraC family transcriptional regulator
MHNTGVSAKSRLELSHPPDQPAPTTTTTVSLTLSGLSSGAHYRGLQEDGFRVSLRSDPAGLLEMPGAPNTYVSIHVGPSVQMACRRGGSYHRGTVVHGDIDIIPAGLPSAWELTATDTALLLRLSPALLNKAAEESDIDPRYVEIRNRFQVRDPQLENIGWALKAEMESGYPCGRLYLDSLALAVAVRLVHFHSSLSLDIKGQHGGLSGRRLREVLSYIEDNVGEDISLGDVAAVSGLSASHFKRLFRQSVGVPVHQYLIQRRVERAKGLLEKGELSISQIALETGFAHQSHLAHHMRRVLGISPKALRDNVR